MESQTMGTPDLPDKLKSMIINPWLLGADPEFAILTPPDVTIPNLGEHAVNKVVEAGGVGNDHSGRVWELRPAPSPFAYTVTRNIWRLLRLADMEKVARFKWKSGALGGKKLMQLQPIPPLEQLIQQYTNVGYPLGQSKQLALAQHQMLVQQQAQYEAAAQAAPDTLGGHVHYGIRALNASQKAALDRVTTGLLNLDILPMKENQKRIMVSQYGKISGGDSVRSCDGHVEYRCAPSWLDKPGQAFAALTIYKLAAARPSSVEWPESFQLKGDLLDWLEELGVADVDAAMLSRYISNFGFEGIQADPSSDFKPRWRKEDLWSR